MVAHWGMSDRLGPVAYHLSEEHPFLGKELHEQRQFSEHTAQLIDEEVAQLLHKSADQARDLLEQNRDKLVAIAEALIEREILNEDETTELIGPSVNNRSTEVTGSPQSVSNPSSED
jgi:cell division protease FtsH